MLTSKNLINILISLIPLSIILGNLAININIILICFLGMAIYRAQLFFVEEKIYQYLIYTFFLYLILITLFKNIPNLNNDVVYKEHIIKSFSFLRFLVLFLVINKLIESKSLNINLLFISCSFFSFFVAFDILVQVIHGENLLGYPITWFRPSGVFGQEHIAGGYLQRFSYFLIFSPFLYFKKNKVLCFCLVILFFLISIFFTANKMPLLLYIFSILVFFVLEKKIKELFIVFLVIGMVFFTTIKFTPVERMAISWSSMVLHVSELFTVLPKLFNNEVVKELHAGSGYILHFNSGYQVWKQNKVFGGGLKSFRLNCSFAPGQTCNTHPHNYVLEILAETGLIGLTLIYSFFFIALFNFIRNYNKNFNSSAKFFALPFFLIAITEFFPIKSSGSFFTTGDSVIIFVALAVLINSSKLGVSNK